jgi:hypothetical protein
VAGDIRLGDGVDDEAVFVFVEDNERDSRIRFDLAVDDAVPEGAMLTALKKGKVCAFTRPSPPRVTTL